jgi:hypothetical protein
LGYSEGLIAKMMEFYGVSAEKIKFGASSAKFGIFHYIGFLVNGIKEGWAMEKVNLRVVLEMEFRNGQYFSENGKVFNGDVLMFQGRFEKSELCGFGRYYNPKTGKLMIHGFFSPPWMSEPNRVIKFGEDGSVESNF